MASATELEEAALSTRLLLMATTFITKGKVHVENMSLLKIL